VRRIQNQADLSRTPATEKELRLREQLDCLLIISYGSQSCRNIWILSSILSSFSDASMAVLWTLRVPNLICNALNRFVQ